MHQSIRQPVHPPLCALLPTIVIVAFLLLATSRELPAQVPSEASPATEVLQSDSSRAKSTALGVLTAAEQAAKPAELVSSADFAEQANSPSARIQLLVKRMAIGIGFAGALALILVVTVGKKGSARGLESADNLSLVSTISIAPRCCLSLVRAEGQSVLIARDASGVQSMLVLEKAFDTYPSDGADNLTFPTLQSLGVGD